MSYCGCNALTDALSKVIKGDTEAWDDYIYCQLKFLLKFLLLLFIWFGLCVLFCFVVCVFCFFSSKNKIIKL